MRRAAMLAVVVLAVLPRDVLCDEGSLDEYADPDEYDEGLDEFGEPIVQQEEPAAAEEEEKEAEEEKEEQAPPEVDASEHDGGGLGEVAEQAYEAAKETLEEVEKEVVEEVEQVVTEALEKGHAGKKAARAMDAEEEARQRFYDSIGNDGEEDEQQHGSHEEQHTEQQHTEQHNQRWAAHEEAAAEEDFEDPYGDPYGAHWDEEDEDEDEEVEYPGGAQFSDGLERAPDGVKRPPFSIKKWHDVSKAYVDPEDEKDYKDTEEAHFRSSFAVGRLHGIRRGLHDDHRDDQHEIKMTAGGILTFFMAALNPDDVELHVDEVEMIEEEVRAMRQHEGLIDDKQQLFYGYIANGKPKKRLLRLMDKLNKMRTAREGDGTISAEEQMRERDLLAEM